MNALEIKDLCKTYPGFSLDHLNLTVPCGCIVGLIGENGAGKSTTMKLILDMIRKDSGSVQIFGKDNQKHMEDLKEDIGVVPDEVGLPGCLTALQAGNIMRRTFRRWDDNVYRGYLASLSIPPQKKFREYSRGTKMKLGIAIALSHSPKLLLLDESTSGLDPVVRDEVLDIFNEFTRDESHAVLISSHIVSDLEKICDYIAFLHRGKLLLFREKDLLREQYGIIHCTKEQLTSLDPEAVLGKKESSYGVEALVDRNHIPSFLSASPADIEQLFIFMAKEANAS